MAANAQLNRQAKLNRKDAVQVPVFPNLFQSLKRRMPEQRIAFEGIELELVKWREQLQLAINRAIGSLEELIAGGGSVGAPVAPGVTVEEMNTAIAAAISDAIAAIPAPTSPTYAAAGNLYGVGDPNGIKTASRGAHYDEFTTGFIAYNRTWIKSTDNSNTGWI